MTVPEQESEIVAGDARLRTWTLLLAALVLVAGLLLLWVLQAIVGEIQDLAARDLPTAVGRMTCLVRLLAGLTGLCLVAIAVWFWCFARKITAAGRFPPPGMKVIKDTAVRTGERARSMARMARVCAVLFFLTGTVGMWGFYCLAASVLGAK